MDKTDKELFRIKPLEWKDQPANEQHDGGYRADTILGFYEVYQRDGRWAWFGKRADRPHFPKRCASPEEGKQLAEQHWNEYIKQALEPVETNE